MKKPMIIKRKGIINTGRNYAYIVFSALFTAGVIIGCSTVKRADSDVIKALSELLGTLVQADIKNSFIKCLLSSLTAASLFPLIAMLAGFSAIGAPVAALIPFALGGVCGITASAYYCSYGIKGIGFCTLVIFPFLAIVTATVIKCCNESIIMSTELFGFLTFNSKTKSKKPELKEFCAKYAVLCIPLIIAALFRAVGILLFTEMFDFI